MSYQKCGSLKLIRNVSSDQKEDETKFPNIEWKVAVCDNNLSSSISRKDESNTLCSPTVSNSNSIDCSIKDNQDSNNKNKRNVSNTIAIESSSSCAADRHWTNECCSYLMDSETGTYLSYYDTSDSLSTSSNEGSEMYQEDTVNERRSRKNGKTKISGEAQQRRKNQFPNPENWEKNRIKRLRNSGQSYVSSSRKKVFEAKKVLPPCNEKCKMKCYEKFTEGERQKIFQNYWGLASLQKQRDFLLHSMSDINPKYRYAKESSNRRLNSAFFFEVREEKIRVCKYFFKSTLCINDRPIRTVLQKKALFSGKMISSELRGKHGKHVTVDEDIKDGIRNHIRCIPRIPGHYCHSASSKEFVLGGKSIADLFRDYENSCKENKIIAANYTMFSRIFNDEFNLSFLDPRKANCGLCIAYARDNEKTQCKDGSHTHLKETK